MPTAKKLKSGSWRCQVFSHFEEVTQEDGTVKKKRIYKSFTCRDPSKKGKRMCEQMASDWAAGKEEERTIQVKDIPFSEAAKGYLEARSSVLSPSTICGYSSILRTLEGQFPDFCRRSINRITDKEVQAIINGISPTHAPKTVRNVCGFISSVMGLYRPDLAFHVSLPRRVRPDIYVPSDGDIVRLMGAVNGTALELPVLLAAFGPMRRGEICALDTKNISGTIVHVCENMVQAPDRQWIVKSPKSYAGDRYIDYPEFVAEKWKGMEGRVTQYTPNNLGTQFGRMLRDHDLPHFRFHDLRHYSASIQHALGVPDSYIMQRGGWGSDVTLKSVYRHAMSEQAQQMNARTNAHFEELCNTKCNTK